MSQTIRESSSADSVLGIVVAVNAAKAPDASASVLNGASILVPELDGMPARMLRRELMHAGVERAVPEALRTKTDDPEGAILEAVASGRADAGILPACYVERLSATDPKRLSGIRLVTTDRASQTRCRSFSVFYPGWTLASFPHTPPELNALVSGTLLGMPTDADGCDWRPGARYDAVHELLEALGVICPQRVAVAEDLDDDALWCLLFHISHAMHLQSCCHSCHALDGQARSSAAKCFSTALRIFLKAASASSSVNVLSFDWNCRLKAMLFLPFATCSPV